MSFSAGSLRAVLEAHLPPAATGLVVAVSGGLDSMCLATALAQPGTPPLRGLPLRALHVDHGLQPAAAEFRAACSLLCRRLDIPLNIVAVTVDARSGVSIEASARAARYQALSGQLAAGECLLTAHHCLDQAETLLLQLLRGAGLKGLSAMPLCRPFGAGWHLRPLLDVAKRELVQFADESGISAAADPMNGDARFDRAYLRAELWPVLERRWPGAATALSRTARHAADAQALLDQSAALELQKLRDGDALSIPKLRALGAAQRCNVVRHWIAAHAPMPPTARLNEALRQIIDADSDHLPAVIWGEYALRRYRDRLFLTAAHPPRLAGRREWQVGRGAALDLGPQLGTLRWSVQSGGLDAARLPSTLLVRSRAGGETLRPQRRARTHSVQHLLQSRGVPPWLRDALPLVYAGDDLVAIGDLWQDARWCVDARAPGLACVWENAPLLT